MFEFTAVPEIDFKLAAGHLNLILVRPVHFLHCVLKKWWRARDGVAGGGGEAVAGRGQQQLLLGWAGER